MDNIKSGSRAAWQTTKNGVSIVWTGIKTGARRTKNKFERHPKSINQSYRGHMWKSFKASGYAFWVSFQYLVHGCFPFCFERHCDLNENQGLMRDDVPMNEVEHDDVLELDFDEEI